MVVGGGFAGATCARFIRRIDPRIDVTLVEASPTFTACPFSNDVIAGLRDLTAQQFGYDKLANDRRRRWPCAPASARRRAGADR